MGVFQASIGNQNNDIEALKYFEKALGLAKINKEDVYEINVLVNMALIFERLNELRNSIQCLE